MRMNLRVINPKLSRIMLWFFQYFWILPLSFGTMISVVETQQTATLDWNKNNPRFVPGVGAKLTISLNTNFRVNCPYGIEEYYWIYWVTEEEFVSCSRLTNKTKLFLYCHNPNMELSFTQGINEFTPGAKDFHPGQNYYLTAFSTGTEEGQGNEYGGACATYSMKLNLTIVHEPTRPTVQTHGPTNETKPTTRQPSTPTPRSTLSSTRRTKTTTERTTPQHTTPRRTTQKPHSTDIPDPPVINVPDEGNTGTIVADGAATSLTYSWALFPCLCLSILHILNNAHITWTVR